KVLGLLRGPSARLFWGDFLTLAEIAPALPDDGRGGGVLGLLPDRRTAVLTEAVQSAIQGRQVDVPFGQHGGGDDLPAEPRLPDLAAGTEIKGGKVVVVVASAVGVGDVDPAAAEGGHTHERVAQPALPNGPARDSEHSQFATFGVEGDVAVTDHGRCGA